MEDEEAAVTEGGEMSRILSSYRIATFQRVNNEAGDWHALNEVFASHEALRALLGRAYDCMNRDEICLDVALLDEMEIATG